MASLAPALREFDHGFDVEPFLALGIDREAELLQALQRLCLAADPRRRRVDRFAGLLEGRRGRRLLDELVEPRREAAGGRHARVELAQGTRAAVARVGIQGQGRFFALGVDPREFGLGHEDLAAGFHGSRATEAARDSGHGSQVGCHVLAGEPVAPRRALRESAPLVVQRHREAIDLELSHVAQLGCFFGRARQTQAAAHS